MIIFRVDFTDPGCVCDFSSSLNHFCNGFSEVGDENGLIVRIWGKGFHVDEIVVLRLLMNLWFLSFIYFLYFNLNIK